MRVFGAVLITLVTVSPAFAQSEQALKTFFEGKSVVVKIDMPATSAGIDILADAARPVDYKEYGDRIRANGTSIKSGESTIVTTVRVKDKVIEFQLGGGGFGTFFDDSSTSVYVPTAPKTSREKNLERDVKNETDRDKRRRMQEELDDLRREREREDRRNQAAAKDAEEEKKARVAEQRLKGGSRFNLRYQGAVPRGITSEQVMAALAEFVDFSGGAKPVTAKPASAPAPTASMPSAPSSQTGTLRKGLAMSDVEAMLGKPLSKSEKKEGTLNTVTAVFQRGDERIETYFVEGILTKYSISSK